MTAMTAEGLRFGGADARAPVDADDFLVGEGVVVVHEPGGDRAEAIGAMRNHLAAQHLAAGRRALALCSPTPGVGCTSLAVNLAVALAESGRKTLLVDADLRDPAVDLFIAPAFEVPGLRQCLEGDRMDPEDAIQFDVFPDLSILYAGGASDRPQELLATVRLAEVVAQCVRGFEAVVIDTPPSSLSADARRLAGVAGHALLVAGRDATFLSDLRLLADELAADRVNVVGSVLSAG